LTGEFFWEVKGKFFGKLREVRGKFFGKLREVRGKLKEVKGQ